MGPTKNTKFNEEWLQEVDFSAWLKAVSGKPHSAQCTWCHTTFSLSNMGRRALSSHAESKKHRIIWNTRGKSHDVAALLSPNALQVAPIIPAIRNPSTSQSASTAKASTTTSLSIDSAEQDGPEIRSLQLPRITSFLLSESVTRAEILWCLHTVEAHNSLRAAAKGVALFTLMFPDSAIAQKIQLQRTKLAYLLVHGLAPFFHNELVQDCNNCTDIVVGFDESLNEVAQLGQMDITVRFWCQRNNQVTTRYFTSAFLNHATAADLLRAFTSALSELKIKMLLQVSMDGPNVNVKFHRDLRESLASDPDDPLLVDIGSCGLHTVNCALRRASKQPHGKFPNFSVLSTLSSKTHQLGEEITHTIPAQKYFRKSSAACDG
ncbi:uncharacterized protein LOC125501448 isoform X1 [Athalia rosae]|uniref:uncharacterized protein LOC125501448 isoform X1 n=1 Tax=Athalia rosae TaxID=37344 RepID=UPI002033D494|nr:uncharacterized protein LOC125501448 isoform X1 [Athalia rosae]XP_048513398.1 uncharacterized protein LOC125501448 isoform X1 [Athalia rosae]